MFISIVDRGDLLDDAKRLLIERRLLFALARFELRIKQVDLVIHDENGPRGGIDKSCRISVALHQASDVVISDRDSDIFKSISRVADRAARAVSRAISRANEFDRTHLRAQQQPRLQ